MVVTSGLNRQIAPDGEGYLSLQEGIANEGRNVYNTLRSLSRTSNLLLRMPPQTVRSMAQTPQQEAILAQEYYNRMHTSMVRATSDTIRALNILHNNWDVMGEANHERAGYLIRQIMMYWQRFATTQIDNIQRTRFLPTSFADAAYNFMRSYLHELPHFIHENFGILYNTMFPQQPLENLFHTRLRVPNTFYPAIRTMGPERNSAWRDMFGAHVYDFVDGGFPFENHLESEGDTVDEEEEDDNEDEDEDEEEEHFNDADYEDPEVPLNPNPVINDDFDPPPPSSVRG